VDCVAVGAELSLQIQHLCVLSIFHKGRHDPMVSLRAGF